MSRNQAWIILNEYIKNENLIKHALAVEAAMAAYAQKFGEDVEKWRILGLLHDFDYEKFPDESEHALKGAEILKEKDYSEDIVKAVKSHNPYHNIIRDTLMEKTLAAVDELTGFLIACVLVRPSKSFKDLEPKSVKKKMKDKAFAKNVKREDIIKGAEELKVSLDEHISFVTKALDGIADQLGFQ
ncbi:HDIG domain-containing protein [bacterium]|nr:HDIG domain-containing protein [bacterium]